MSECVAVCRGKDSLDHESGGAFSFVNTSASGRLDASQRPSFELGAQRHTHWLPIAFLCFITAEKGGVACIARAKGVGEKEKESTAGCKSQQRLDEMSPWTLDYWNGEGGGDAKGRRRGGEERASRE